MNVCLISMEYPPETGWGGVGRYTHALAHSLTDRGHTVHVISWSPQNLHYSYLDGQVYVHRLSTCYWPFSEKLCNLHGGWNLVILQWSIAVASLVSSLHKQVGFDVVEAPNCNASALIYCLRPPVPLVIRISTPVQLIQRYSGQFKRSLFGLTSRLDVIPVRRANRLIAHSEFGARIAEQFYGIARERVQVVHLGLKLMRGMQTATFHVKEGAHIACHDHSATQDASGRRNLTVLYVGRLEQRKGVRNLVEAIPQVIKVVPHARFRLVGADMRDAPGGRSYSEYLASLGSREAQLATSFLGYVEESKLEQEFAGCDLFVAPSLFESFGLTNLEAMWHGKPVVSCNVAAVPEIVLNGETGLLVPPNDTNALAQAIIRLLRTPDEARRMGERGRVRAISEFSLDQMVEGTLKVYEEAAKLHRVFQ